MLLNKFSTKVTGSDSTAGAVPRVPSGLHHYIISVYVKLYIEKKRDGKSLGATY